MAHSLGQTGAKFNMSIRANKLLTRRSSKDAAKLRRLAWRYMPNICLINRTLHQGSATFSRWRNLFWYSRYTVFSRF